MTLRIEAPPHGANFVPYSAGPQHDSAVSYSGVARDVVRLILSFTQEGRFSRVSREWQRQNCLVLQGTIRWIRFEDEATQTSMARVREELVASGQTVLQAAEAATAAAGTAMRDLSRLYAISSLILTGVYPRLSQPVTQVWLEFVKCYMQTPEGEREGLDLRIIIFNREVDRSVQIIRANNPETLEGTPEYERLLEDAHRFIVRENLAVRLHKAVRDHHLNPARVEDVARSLNALHERQREVARSLGQNSESVFHPAPPSDTPSYFFALESEFRRRRLADPEQTLALQSMWHGPQNPPTPIADIRNEIMNLGNAYPGITDLGRENLSVIPPEIGRLTALRKISWMGALLGLPEEMEELTHLTHLFLRNTSFSDLPSVLERIPNLECLSIENNRQPIRKISERLWTNLMGVGFVHTVTAWMLAQKIRVIYNADLDQMRELPFEMWFLNNYTLPYIPSPIPVVRVAHREENFLNIFWRLPFVTAWALLNLPIFLVNLFIATVIRPRVTAIRDARGYSRMIHL